MPKWIHDRAKHIQEKHPEMPESQAFAIATQQAHAVGKSPKGYGTAEGRQVAKAKYDAPKGHYQKTAEVSALLDELQKIAFDTATAMEAIGIPAAMYMGYKKNGLAGAGITGLGAVGGLGAGMAGSHYVKKLTDASPWMRRHQLVKALVDSAPVGMGGILGGTAGEHYAGGHGHGAKVASVVSEYLARRVNPVLLLDTINDVGKLPYRVSKINEEFHHDPYDAPGSRHAE